jgi:hypothetical protein
MLRKHRWLAGLPLLLIGCGGGGGGGDPATPAAPPTAPPAVPTPIAGLELPEKFSVISATEGGGTGGSSKPVALKAKGFAATLSALKTFDAADTDYSTDKTHVYVYDRSMESLGIINEIVCYIDQTGAGQMVNRGPYVALVNEDRCRQGQNGNGGATGESTAGSTAQFSRWIVESTRDDNTATQLVRIWVPDPEGEGGLDGEQAILVELTIDRGVSETEPFGSFALSFRGVLDGAAIDLPGVEIETMRGRLATGDDDGSGPRFTFVSIGGSALPSAPPMDFGYENAASVRLDDAAGTSGLALTSTNDSWNRQGQSGSRHESFALAYDAERFLSHRDDDDDGLAEEAVCRARDEYDVHAWRYNLYHERDGEFRGQPVTGGERVELNSGFPFSYDSGTSGDLYGWLGYHGVWTESGVTPPDGQSIQSFDYASDTTVDYTLHVAPGRLTRRVANVELLAGFVGDSFQFSGRHPTLGLFGQWLVTVDAGIGFAITSTFSWNDQGIVLSSSIDHDANAGTPPVPVSAALQPAHNEVLWMWSETLGGGVVYTQDDSVPAASRTITFFAQEFVTAADTSLFPSGTSEVDLYCYDRCLKGGLTQSDVDGADGPWDLYHDYVGTALPYTLSVVDGKVLLTDRTTGAPVDASSLGLESMQQGWGISTGEMLTERLADESRPWTVNERAMSFRWETGPNSWNRMVTATDVSGSTIVLDRPLQMSYVHSTANDANGSAEYAGKRFLLHYGGAGNLGGLPWLRDGDRSYSTVTLADGVVLTDDSNGFVVKAIEREQTMRAVDVAECADLDAAAAYTTLTLPTADDIGAVSITLAGRPELAAAAPAVIEGQLQE